MRISVVIPTFNSSATIEATLNSVFRQTMPPDEILVLDDGSTDATVSLLNLYKDRITIIEQKNMGVAAARNSLCVRARGRLVAFLDHDDLWHPRYLEAQWNRFNSYTQAVGFFAGHLNFSGYGEYEWTSAEIDSGEIPEVISPVAFFRRLHVESGSFGSASLICVPKQVLTRLGDRPFHERVSGVDDCYLCCHLARLGPIVYAPEPLVAYRIIKDAQSVDKVRACRLLVSMFHILQCEGYEKLAGSAMAAEFRRFFASARRSYAKRLMSIGNTSEARVQLRRSFVDYAEGSSFIKSLALMLLTAMPSSMQPEWPASRREWKEPTAR